MKSLLLALWGAVAVLLPTTETGEEIRPAPSEASALVETLMADAAAAYADEGRSDDEKRRAFRDLLVDAFGADFMAAYAIRGLEDALSAEQRDAYRRAFPGYFAGSFASQFEDAAGRPFLIDGVREAGSKDVVVESRIERDSGPDVEIDWRVRSIDGEPKIIDVVVGGSLLAARRRDIRAALDARGPDGMIAAMEALDPGSAASEGG